MSIVYLGTEQIALAERLAESLEEQARDDIFRAATIVVPNRYLAKWLRLWLARTRGIAINLRFVYLEAALWELLREQDTRPHEKPLALLDQEGYRLMVLSVLLESDAPELAPLRHYVGALSADDRGEGERQGWRRAWHLADRLGRLIRDYEYHRQDALIQHWLRGDLAFPGGDSVPLERSQREVFHQITRLPDGKRELLCRTAGKEYKTLPQYAMEVMEFITTPSAAAARPRRVHLFGATQISALHLRTLRWLGERYDLWLYHINPLAALLPDSDLRSALRAIGAKSLDNELLRLWGQAGRESLTLLSELVDGPFQVQRAPSWSAGAALAIAAQRERGTRAGPCTVLSRLQDHLLHRAAAAPRQPQDPSLQIVACPGIYREVETVANSILHNLQHTPDLKQTDIAVLVTDMARYRPVLQAVFDRHEKLLRYNLADYSAAGASAFGQALLGFLDLALESFTRSRVLEVLLNPCFLARLKVERTQAASWLTWAEALGVYHGWDAKDRAERGYGDSPLFGWQLALRRLRLGRFMTAAAEAAAPRFRGVLPYADLASSDKEQLNAFCWAVEGLLPALVQLRRFRGSGSQWAGRLQTLAQTFLDIPADRPEEGQVRDKVLRVLEQLRTLDQLLASPPNLPLALVREMVVDNLEAIEGMKGEYLTGGVTISALQPLRPVPFRVLYVVGLGEELFPGSNLLPSFDLRSEGRCPGDIRPAEQNRFLFLEALLAARDKIYLLYTSRELQRDHALYPSTALRQLQRFLKEHVIGGAFETVDVPLSGYDLRYLDPEESAISDVLVNYNDTERLMAVADAELRGEVELAPAVEQRLRRGLEKSRRDYTLPAPASETNPGGPELLRGPLRKVPTISLGELRRFLRCPAEASVRRHLHLADDEEIEQQDEEPFVTDKLQASRLISQALDGFVSSALRDGVTQTQQAWRRRFAERFEEWRLSGRVPDGVFGQIDREALEKAVGARVEGADGLAAFLEKRQACPFVGPVLLGESLAPIHAKIRFPALRLTGLELFGPKEARLVGTAGLVWRADKVLEILSVSTSAQEAKPEALCRAMLLPALFQLALKAGVEPGDGGLSSADWLGRRDVLVHVAHRKGIASYRYRAGDISSAEARDYLAALAADLLDAEAFDLLPFDLIVKSPALARAYLAGEAELEEARRGYRARLEEALAEDREAFRPTYYMPDIVALVDPQVPSKAFDKVRDRFGLLARGLAEPPPRTAKPAKRSKRKDTTRGHARAAGGGPGTGSARRSRSVGRDR